MRCWRAASNKQACRNNLKFGWDQGSTKYTFSTFYHSQKDRKGKLLSIFAFLQQSVYKSTYINALLLPSCTFLHLTILLIGNFQLPYQIYVSYNQLPYIEKKKKKYLIQSLEIYVIVFGLCHYKLHILHQHRCNCCQVKKLMCLNECRFVQPFSFLATVLFNKQ